MSLIVLTIAFDCGIFLLTEVISDVTTGKEFHCIFMTFEGR